MYLKNYSSYTFYYLVFFLLLSYFELSAQNLDWNQLNSPGQPTEFAAITASQTGTIYAISNDSRNLGIIGIYSSEDGGDTWEFVSLDPQPGIASASGTDLDIDSDGNLYHVDKNLLKSEDGGQTWLELDTGGGLFESDAELAIDSEQRVYLRKNSDNGIYLSEDSGNNWSQILAPSDNIDGMYIDENDNVYAWGDFGIEFTEDFGENWSLIFDQEIENFTSASDGRIVATNDKILYYSDDDGANWNEIENEFFFSDLYFDNEGTLFTIDVNDGVLISEDGGETWTEQGDGLFERPRFGMIEGEFLTINGTTFITNRSDPAKSFGAAPLYKYNVDNKVWTETVVQGFTGSIIRDLVKTDNAWYGIFGLRLFKSTDKGENWEELNTTDLFSPISLAVSSNGDIFIASGTFISRSKDGGDTWNELPESDEVGSIEIRASEMHTTSTENIVYTNFLNTLLIWDNEADEWTRIGDNLLGSSTPRNIWFNSHNEQLYADVSGTLYTTEDKGDTWTELTSDEFSSSIDRLFTLAFLDDQTLYAITNKNLRKSVDGGKSWEETAQDLNGDRFGNTSPAGFTAFGEGNLLLDNREKNSENYGLLISNDEGQNWQLEDNFVPGHITMITKLDNNIYIGTKGNGLFESDELTGTSNELVSGELPQNFKLHQNYPNPFNPSTVISYQINSPSKVTQKVFDMLGKEVALLVNEQKNAGTYSLTFDASRLSSGMYIYQLQTGDFSQTRKMILIK